MKITFTKHSIKKFKDFAKLKIKISRNHIRKALKNPQHTDPFFDYPNKINSIIFDEKRILRVVYREENDTIIIVTFYPAKKGRYYETSL